MLPAQTKPHNLKRLNTHLVAPFQHKMRNSNDSFIMLTDSGWLSLILGKTKKIHISGDGGQVVVENKNVKKEYRPFENNSSTDLPEKLRPFYVYASECVEAVRQTQPKIIVRQNKQVSAPDQTNHNLMISTVFTLSGHVETTI